MRERLHDLVNAEFNKPDADEDEMVNRVNAYWAYIQELETELDQALKDQQFLSALECAGVDNWDGYDEAKRLVREWDNEAAVTK